ncbi:MAG: DUF3429 family protein [Burkholderiaceae bacterium]|nr:DUF3429 family protein [Burkholderiaceae bacterium]
MYERVTPLKRNAWRLGAAGSIPLVALAVLAWMPDAQRAATAVAYQVQYAAILLTFVGALHWGIVLTERMLSPAITALALLWSVLPGLYAWPVALMPAKSALSLLVAGLLVAFVADTALYREYSVPRWFIGLRFVLTVVACLALIATWFAPRAAG